MRTCHFSSISRGAALSALLILLSIRAQAAGIISGVVLDDTKNPLGGATVTLMAARGSIGAPPQTNTGARGTFAFATLNPGLYTVCVSVPSGIYINPCTWSTNPTVVNLLPGKDATGVQVSLKKGSVVKIRFADPQKLLPTKKGKGQPRLMVGVFTPQRMFVPAIAVAQDGTGRDHEVIVPTDMPLQLHLSSPDLLLKDENNNDVNPNGHTVGFQQAGDGKGNAMVSQAQKAFVFNIVKKNPNPPSNNSFFLRGKEQ